MKPQFATEKVEETKNYGKFILSPLPHGFGHTMGNALRRTLLSSLKGYAVSYVKINDIVHPFSTIDGITQTGLEIILNIKLLRFKAKGRGPFTMTLSNHGKQAVVAGDFKGGDVEVVNKDQVIADLTTPSAKLAIELTIEEGIGYSSAEEKEQKEFGRLAVDSIFSPVKKVSFEVSGARVGRLSNFDKLIIEVWTDGSMEPSSVLKDGSSLLSQYFAYILSGHDEPKEYRDDEGGESELSPSADRKVYQTIIDELDLPTRVVNALLRENIETVEDLVKRGKDDLVGLKGVGKKSLNLIEAELEKLGVPFKIDEA